MTYQVLARKWRPKDFASLVGQDHVVRALTHALDQQRLHHAYLFTGTRGVGKTTLSRILAKALNCETGITSVPCGTCRACREIDAGRFVDYVEMDAASNRGVDEMAALLERAIYAPVDARFKVYMIDEVHMLTNHAFNAMLKTLEEPPAHVKFILATTDPQKIPVTVLSRCLQFNLKQMPASDIVSHLDHVLGAEGIGFEAQALRLLSRAADGSMRDALSLTDQAIAYAAGTVSEEAVRGMLGALDQTYLIRLLDGVMAGDGVGVLAIADEMASRSLSFSIALQDLAQLLNRIGWAQYASASVLDEWPEAQEIRRLAQVLPAEQIQLLYQIATMGRSELGLAPDEYAGFTMTLLRMLAFRPVTSGSTMLSGATGGAAQVRATGSARNDVRSDAAPVSGVSSARPASRAAPETAPVRPAISAEQVPQGEPALPSVPPVPPARSLAAPVFAPASVPQESAAAVASDVVENRTEGREDRHRGNVGDLPPAEAAAAGSVREAVYTREPFTHAVPASPTPAEVAPPLVPARSTSMPAPAPIPASASASNASAARTSPARAALEALGNIAGANRTAPRAPLARPSVPVTARPPAPSVRSTPPVEPAAVLAPSFGMSGNATTSSSVLVPLARTVAAASDDAPDDEAPPWAAAPWDDYGAAAFLDSAQQDTPRTKPGIDAPVTAVPVNKPDSVAAPSPAPVVELPPGMRLTALGCDEDWPTFAAALDVKGLAQQVALQSELIETNEIDASRGMLRLRIPVAQLASGAHVDKVIAAIGERVGRTVELHIEVGPVRVTAAAVDAARKAQAQRLAEAAIQSDPFVQALLREFDASIMPGSTQAISGHAAG